MQEVKKGGKTSPSRDPTKRSGTEVAPNGSLDFNTCNPQRLQSEVVKLDAPPSSGKKSRNFQNLSRIFESTNNVNIAPDDFIVLPLQGSNATHGTQSKVDPPDSFQSPRQELCQLVTRVRKASRFKSSGSGTGSLLMPYHTGASSVEPKRHSE